MSSRDPLVRPGIDVHQFYSLDMPHVAEVARADIFSFTGHRAIGEPDKYTIQFTHPNPDLSRSDFLNHMAAFVIQPPPTRWSEPEEPRRVQGVITAFAQLPGSPDQTTYEVTLESRLALLRNTPRYRHFLEKKDPEIIQQILKEHEFNQIFAEAVFDLYRQYRKRPIVMQWGEDDLTFIQRLCRRSGIWFACEEGKLCGRVRFGDDFSKYTRDRERFERPYHEPGGLLTSGREFVKSLVTRSATMAASQVVRSFSPDEPLGMPIEAERESEHVRRGKDWVADHTTYGEAYAWGMPYSDVQAAKEEVTLRHEAARATQVTVLAKCHTLRGIGSGHNMQQRAYSRQGDSTTNGGYVFEGIEGTESLGRELSYLFAKVRCFVCKTDGFIAPSGSRPKDDLGGGKQTALEFDICKCRCDPPPRLIASDRDMTAWV
ncbi:type VI secretion system tip protein VgrG [Paraburkholderia heleia]|uniref:type VI secretion system tip protein VgrG n=1 Tax=Paraburkholderia heleia TaxID=634127 RepID=UPI002AB62C29|nr:type VI secretion system tip protein VgrG [Paraburkholderia heleia]